MPGGGTRSLKCSIGRKSDISRDGVGIWELGGAARSLGFEESSGMRRPAGV